MSFRKGVLFTLAVVLFVAMVSAPVSSDAESAVNKMESGGVSLIVFSTTAMHHRSR